MARPERLNGSFAASPAASVNRLRRSRSELPTARFVEVAVETDTNRNSKLDGPPSPLKPLRSVESRQNSVNRYVFATLTVYWRMSAFIQGGRSKREISGHVNGCFRPGADIRSNKKEAPPKRGSRDIAVTNCQSSSTSAGLLEILLT